MQNPGCSCPLTVPAESIHTLSTRGTRMVKGWNPLVALVRTPYGYEDLGNSTHPNHKSWEQLRFRYQQCSRHLIRGASRLSDINALHDKPTLLFQSVLFA